jgi:hypothetical protein
MKQTVFEFAKDNVLEQLELFPTDIYDNRVQRLRYSLKLSNWLFFNLKYIEDCVKLFQVSHQTVYEQL